MEKFADVDKDLDPDYLSIKVTPDKTRTVVRHLSGQRFQSLEKFTLDYIGSDRCVDIEAIMFRLNLEQVKLISLHVSYLNVVEFLLSLKDLRLDSFTLTTSVLTLRRHELHTAKFIRTLLKQKYNKYTVLTINEAENIE